MLARATGHVYLYAPYVEECVKEVWMEYKRQKKKQKKCRNRQRDTL